MKTIVLFLIVSRSVLLRVRIFSGINCRENQNTHFVYLFFIYLFPPPQISPFMR